MPSDAWSSAQKELDQLIKILLTNSSYAVNEVVPFEYDELVERTPETEEKEGRSEGVVRIRGSIISFVDRLDDEFTRSLQNIDPHGTEYIERLRDEKALYGSILGAQMFFERAGQEENRDRVILRRLEHIYYKVRIQVLSRGFWLPTASVCSPISLLKPSSKSMTRSPLVHL